MTIQRFLTEKDARSFAARALKGEREDIRVVKAEPVKLSESSVADAMARRQRILARP